MLFGVFDGHGGKEVAVYAEQSYTKTLTDLAEFKSGNYEVALRKSFLNLDA